MLKFTEFRQNLTKPVDATNYLQSVLRILSVFSEELHLRRRSLPPSTNWDDYSLGEALKAELLTVATSFQQKLSYTLLIDGLTYQEKRTVWGELRRMYNSAETE